MNKEDLFALTESFCVIEHTTDEDQNKLHELSKIILARFDAMRSNAFVTFQLELDTRLDRNHCKLVGDLIMQQSQHERLRSLQIFPRNQCIIVSAFFI